MSCTGNRVSLGLLFLSLVLVAGNPADAAYSTLDDEAGDEHCVYVDGVPLSDSCVDLDSSLENLESSEPEPAPEEPAQEAAASPRLPPAVIVAPRKADMWVDTLDDPSDAKRRDCPVTIDPGSRHQRQSDSEPWCSLRAALLVATAFPHETNVTITLPEGSIKLISTLPEIKGTVSIIGAVTQPDSLAAVDTQALERLSEPEKAKAKRATVINGRRRIQLLRTAQGSVLYLHRIDLVNGLASAAEAGKNSNVKTAYEAARASHGGAINALGEVVCEDVGFRRNTGESGGAIYFQGIFMQIVRSCIEHNVAKACGGGIYLGGGARVHIDYSDVSHNKDNCATSTVEDPTLAKDVVSNSYMPRRWDPASVWDWLTGGAAAFQPPPPQIPPPPTVSEPDKPSIDVSGAIAIGRVLLPWGSSPKGPSLLGNDQGEDIHYFE